MNILRIKAVEQELRDEGWRVIGEAELIDPYLESGSFLLPAWLGERNSLREVIRRVAATHKPSLRVSVTSGTPDGRYRDDVFYVVTL